MIEIRFVAEELSRSTVVVLGTADELAEASASVEDAMRLIDEAHGDGRLLEQYAGAGTTLRSSRTEPNTARWTHLREQVRCSLVDGCRPFVA